MHEGGNMKRVVAVSALATIVFISLADAAQSVTLYAQAGERQTYGGVGASSEIFWSDGESYNSLPEEKRKIIAQTYWGETGFNLLRLWVHTHWTPGYIDSTYGTFIRDAQEANPNVIVYHGPMSAGESNWGELAQQIRDLRDNHDITIEATGITNEPNVQGKGSPSWIASSIKQLRQELDNRDLKDVIVIAPEVSNVDGYGISYLDAIIADGAALNALGAFSTHSYNMCVTKAVADKVWPSMRDKGKQYWMTESSGDGWEDPNDHQFAASCAARFLSDINLCVTHWTYFISYHPCEYGASHDDNGNRRHEMMCYTPEGDIEFLLKFFYFKQLARTFRPGAVMRQSYIPEFGSNERNKWMINTYGDQPPLCGAVGQNADGTWALGICNKTYGSSSWGGELPAPVETYDVTFHVEELEDAGEMDFRVMRSNDKVRIEDEGVETMSGGEITVTVAMSELVTLRTDGDWTGTKREPLARPAGAGRGLEILTAGNAVRVRFDLADACGYGELAAFDLSGARIKTLHAGAIAAGPHAVDWEGPEAAGTYIVRLSTPAMTRAQTFFRAK